MEHRRNLMMSLLYVAILVGNAWGMAHAVSPRPNHKALARLMPPITAVLTFSDGTTEIQKGYGFILGQQLITVNHTISPRRRAATFIRTIYVAGIPLTPAYTHTDYDIAIFQLPATLCERYCNSIAETAEPDLQPDRPIYWVQTESGVPTVQDSRVRHYAWLGQPPPTTARLETVQCHGNLIVEVDAPFRPGTSGSPVFDATTNAIIGMIQGSFVHAGKTTGYFKPLSCLLPLLSQL